MRRLLVMVAVVVAAVVVTVGMHFSRSSPPPVSVQVKSTALDVHMWHWSASRTLSAEEEKALTAAGVSAICQWSASIEAVSNQPRLGTRGGAVTGLDTAERWAVVRLENGCLPMLDGDDDRATVLMDLLTQAYRRAGTRGKHVGLQIDWDIPERRLASYARFLVELRSYLPEGTGLSCTGLLCWMKRRDLLAVLAAVDWWVPQCYAGDVPADPRTARSLVACGDVARTVAACEALGRPYRIGLPLYETAAVWDCDGAPVNNALPLCAESAFASGLPVMAIPGDERLLCLGVPNETMLAGRRIAARSTVLVGMPTVASLAAQLATLRATTGTWFRGASLFRLSAPGDLPSLSAAQVCAAVKGTSVRADFSWRWEGRPGAWVLVLDNRGLADLVAVERPVRLAIAWNGAISVGALPAGLRWSPALAGRPISPAHADSVVVTIPFLRAGAVVRLPALPSPGVVPPPCQPIVDAPDEREERL